MKTIVVPSVKSQIVVALVIFSCVFMVSAEDLVRSLSGEARRSIWHGRFHALGDLRRGDLHEAVTDLKNYLSAFGYLRFPFNETNYLSAEFDELLEEAIRLYQASFNLSVTGAVCNETLRLLHTPRCGREDVADGRLLMMRQRHSSGKKNGRILLPTVAPGHHHENFEGHWAVFSPSGKWQSTRNLSFAFSPAEEEMAPYLPTTDAEEAISAAFATWSSVIPVNFTETTNFTEADIQIKFVGGDHGDGDPFDGRLGIVAHSFAPEDGRFHFDSAEVWTVDLSLTEDDDALDLETVALHEIGHILGLAHTQVEGAVMYPSITLRQVKRELTRDDIEGAQALYGSNYRRLIKSPSCGDLNGKQEEVQFVASTVIISDIP